MWHEPFCAPRKLAALMVVAAWTALAGQALAQRDSAPLPPGTPASPTGLRKMDYLTTVGGLPSAPGASWVQKQPELLDVHFAQERDASRAKTPYNRGRILTRETPKGDSGVRFHTGDAVVTGASGESWPIARATFESTYSAVPEDGWGRTASSSRNRCRFSAYKCTSPLPSRPVGEARRPEWRLAYSVRRGWPRFWHRGPGDLRADLSAASDVRRVAGEACGHARACAQSVGPQGHRDPARCPVSFRLGSGACFQTWAYRIGRRSGCQIADGRELAAGRPETVVDQAAPGHERPYRELTDCGRSMARSDPQGRSSVDFPAVFPRGEGACTRSSAGTS